MDWLDNLHNLKVEVTSYCNAACPGCQRNHFGGKTVDTLDLNHMSLDLWTKIMKDSQELKLQEILFDGAVGDLIMHPKALDIIKIAQQHHPKTEILINTNGGARNTTFWSELGGLLSRYNHRVNFAIDGLEDTHHIHRRNTKFDLIIRNAKAFIEAGGRASWTYTAFDHNIHQIEIARQRAIDLGFTFWELRGSCIPGTDMVVKTESEDYQIGTDNIDDITETLDKIIEEKYPTYYDFNHIDHKCTAYRERQIQIDWEGNLWPCSYIYSTEVQTIAETMSPFEEEKLQHPKDKINLNYNSLTDILQNTFYTKELPDAIESECLTVCKERCGLGK